MLSLSPTGEKVAKHDACAISPRRRI